ncbi:MAG: protein-glutamate O-methyltransferase CheR [SAR324 cluster bacterium]|nr:protein-glutamate O-methyltransferase CheR [SAR324 cluster bacterium]
MNFTQQFPELSKQEFEQFQVFIEQECSISLDDEKAYLLESRLKGLVAEFDCVTFGDLFHKAKRNSVPLLRSKIIDAITTNETLWFRDRGPFTVIEEVFLPEMVRLLAQGRPKVRIWSAACSTGQEPYSIAMVINAFCNRLGQEGVTPDRFEILATDISSEAVSTGKLGAYDRLSMSRGMSDEYKARYFKQAQKYWIIDAGLKKMVEFKEYNLQQEFGSMGTFDAIFCRNVAIYFAQEFKEKLFERLKGVLRPRGLFFLGSSETLTYYANNFQAMEHKNCTYYVA